VPRARSCERGGESAKATQGTPVGLLTAGFSEAFALIGHRFLEAAQGGGPDPSDLGAAHWASLRSQLATREGVVRALRARIDCGCLAQARPGSAAAAECAAANEAQQFQATFPPMPRLLAS
jgi:hypothetical protein